MSEMKICKKCGEEKLATVEYFIKTKGCKGGIGWTCRECLRKYNKQYRLNNKKELAEYRKQYNKDNAEKRAKYYQQNREKMIEKNRQYRKNNPEKIALRKKKYNEENADKVKEYRKEFNKQYRLKNKEKLDAYSKEWRIKNKEYMIEKSSRYAKEHKEVYRLSKQRRKALKRKLPSTLTIEQWESAKKHFDNSCAFCGKNYPLAQEHFVALTKGGEYSHNNIIPSCQSCNSSKGDKNFFEWYPKFKHYSKARERKIIQYLGYKNGVQQLTFA